MSDVSEREKAVNTGEITDYGMAYIMYSSLRLLMMNYNNYM